MSEMKYVVVAGWNKDEWYDFVIAIEDNYISALGEAVNYLDEHIEDAKFVCDNKGPVLDSNARKISCRDVYCISPVYTLEDEAGYLVQIEHKENKYNLDFDEIDYNSGALQNNYVRILTYKEYEDES